jgi:heterotetrameric sarcosine oxidase delta subunit
LAIDRERTVTVMLVPCPWCGPRNASEFRSHGEHTTRPPAGSAAADADPAAWRAYLYRRENRAGWTSETWYHGTGCRRFVVVERHTVTNEIRAVVPAGAAEAGRS